MKRSSLAKYLWLAYFSRPTAERTLFRTIRRLKVRQIVELGIGDATRARRMILVAGRYGNSAGVTYAGIDLFEAGDKAKALSLKQVHQLLKPSGAKVKLIPGDPYSALAREANSLTGTDLVIISANPDAELLRRAWFYVPRLLHAQSVVLMEEVSPAKSEKDEDERTYRPVERSWIEEQAVAAAPRRAA